jgi:hypothetical protein
VLPWAALALGGGASIWLSPAAPLPAVLAIYLLFGIFLGTIRHQRQTDHQDQKFRCWVSYTSAGRQG